MIPTSESEVISELKIIKDSLINFSFEMAKHAENTYFEPRDRELAKAMASYALQLGDSTSDVIIGLSNIFLQKNPSVMSAIIAELVKK